MTIRTVEYELEAKLSGKSGGLLSRPSGKVERKSYGDGGERLKISVRNLKVTDQAVATIRVDGRNIANLTLTKGSARLDNESSDPALIPTLEVGQTIEVHVDGVQILSGKLYVD